jgi:hypothetical protein
LLNEQKKGSWDLNPLLFLSPICPKPFEYIQFRFYNQQRFHQALDNLTPDEVYYDLPHPFAEAA